MAQRGMQDTRFRKPSTRVRFSALALGPSPTVSRKGPHGATRSTLAACVDEPASRVTSRESRVQELLVASSVLSLRIDRGELTMDQAVRQLSAALKGVRSWAHLPAGGAK